MAVVCSLCRTRLYAPLEKIGQTIKCPDCHSENVVPALAEIQLSFPAIAQDGVLAAALDAEGSSVLIATTDDSLPLRDAATGGFAGHVSAGAPPAGPGPTDDRRGTP